jgi:DNA-binding protein Fis
MPRKPKPVNLDNPLRMLRQQLGRVSQDRLGKILGWTNGDAIRNLENGRMKISAEIFRRIIDALGLEYRSRSKRWFVVLSDVPGDWLTVMAWRQSSRPSAELKLRDYQALSYRIAALLGYAKPEDYNMVFGKISRSLEDCLKQHSSNEAKDAFKRSRAEMHIISSSRPAEKRKRLSKEKERIEKERIRQILAASRQEVKGEDLADEYESELELDEILDRPAKAEYRPLSNREIHEITREYNDLPDATELLRGNERGGDARVGAGQKKVPKPSS